MRIFMLGFLACYLVIVFTLIMSHELNGILLKKYNGNTKREEKYWKNQWSKAKEKREGKLKRHSLTGLKNPLKMVAFNKFISDLSSEEQVEFFIKNTPSLLKRINRVSDLLKAYFVYILGYIKYESEYKSEIENFIMKCLCSKSIHLRENALKALYHIGNPQKIDAAFVFLSKENISHSDKLLSDGMLVEYTGDTDELFKELMGSFDDYIECFQDAIVTSLFRVGNHTYDEMLKKYLGEGNNLMDLQCQILRLLGRNPSKENGVFLADYLDSVNEEQYWEGKVVTAGMLGDFEKTEKISESLQKALTSGQWFIRMNAARSLCKLGIGDAEIESIKRMNDRYAMDALNYALSCD